MTKKTKVVLAIISLLSLIGIYFLGYSVVFIFDFFKNPDSPIRHEYLEGVFLSLMLAVPCWLIISILSLIIKNDIKKYLFVFLNLPLMMVISVLVVTAAKELLKAII